MKRNVFTMVKLIFVIVVIGTLSAVVLPKLGGVKDKAKMTTELSSADSINSQMVWQIEMRLDDFDNRDVNWHNEDDMNVSSSGERGNIYKQINKDHKVFSGILKKSPFKIVGWTLVNDQDQYSWNDGLYNDILIVKGLASDTQKGVKPTNKASTKDVTGKPDVNDFWVFNPTNSDITIKSSDKNRMDFEDVVVEAGSMQLVDVKGVKPFNVGYVKYTGLQQGQDTRTLGFYSL